MTQTFADRWGPDDFSDLGFAMERHREALTSFARLDMHPASIRPALRARDLVFVRLPSCRFAMGVTDDPIRREELDRSQGSVDFAVIHQAESAREADLVRGEVEHYFRRHYPGRTLPGPHQVLSDACVYVYITCQEIISE